MPTTPQDRKPKKTADVKPSDVVDAIAEIDELLADLPELRPAHQFRIRHRNTFHNVMLDAAKSGLFDTQGENGTVEIDTDTPEGIEQFQKLTEFLATIDEWAESIATDPVAYGEWAQANSDNPDKFMALFRRYEIALGESKSSES